MTYSIAPSADSPQRTSHRGTQHVLCPHVLSIVTITMSPSVKPLSRNIEEPNTSSLRGQQALTDFSGTQNNIWNAIYCLSGNRPDRCYASFSLSSGVELQDIANCFIEMYADISDRQRRPPILTNTKKLPLDVPFNPEDLEIIIKKFTCGSTSDPDGFTVRCCPTYLTHGRQNY